MSVKIVHFIVSFPYNVEVEYIFVGIKIFQNCILVKMFSRWYIKSQNFILLVYVKYVEI